MYNKRVERNYAFHMLESQMEQDLITRFSLLLAEVAEHDQLSLLATALEELSVTARRTMPAVCEQLQTAANLTRTAAETVFEAGGIS